MADNPLRLLRYNTGNDKKVFVNFKEYFDAVIFNATIVAHSGSAIADLVSIHKKNFIIDPQTHIFQHDLSALQPYKPKGNELKESVKKYLDKLPIEITRITLQELRPLTCTDVSPNIDKLVTSVFKFETDFVNEFIKEKDYGPYLDFVGKKPSPMLIIAPYFMLKKEYSNVQNIEWLSLNKNCLKSFINLNKQHFKVAAQLVIDKDILKNQILMNEIIQTYDIQGYEYVFVWIDEFSSFYSEKESKNGFSDLLQGFNSINKKIVMAYGGYDSILLCNSELTDRVYGVAQSIGYGESRPITPVGGGLPTNKYYFFPTHKRMKFNEVARILTELGYFDESNLKEKRVSDYFENICNCDQCKQLIKKDINNFNSYNDSIPFTINGRYGIISKNRPTTDASYIAAMHFLHCKVREWDDIKNKSLHQLIDELKANFRKYSTEAETKDIEFWCSLYVR